MMQECAADRGSVVLFYDDSIAVCVKPAGVDSQNDMPRLLQTILGGAAYCVHRLDWDVGGVMVYARTGDAAAALSRAVADGRLDKRYLAVCAGRPEADAGEYRDLLYHDAGKNKTYVVTRQRRGVREAVLRYRVLETRDGASLVAVQLLTGRSHQIRVQFASRAMPLLGDAKYGSRERGCPIALWSQSLSFPHPKSGELLRFRAQPPAAEPWTRFSKGDEADA